mmetsp:Transcript_51868/g.166997  ORF Transcript_51868/g.166997 Transcript_51868/m.166997 type:complete len:306 (-) Transcript_51868:949-1866(-)
MQRGKSHSKHMLFRSPSVCDVTISRISLITSSKSMALAGPCRRMAPPRKVSNSILPELVESSTSNRQCASPRSMSRERKKSLTGGSSKCCSISSKVMKPSFFSSSVVNNKLACLTLRISLLYWALSMACCTKVPVITFMTASMANDMYSTKRTPSNGETCSESGAARASQSTPPVRASKSERPERGTFPNHFSNSSKSGLPAMRSRCTTCVRCTPNTYTINPIISAAQWKDLQECMTHSTMKRNSSKNCIAWATRITRTALRMRTTRRSEAQIPLSVSTNNCTSSSMTCTMIKKKSSTFHIQPNI